MKKARFLKNNYHLQKSFKMTDFLAAVGEVAKDQGQDYYSVRVEITQTVLGRLVELRGYIHSGNGQIGKTVAEVLQKLRDHHKQPKPSPVEDVTF